MSSFIVKFCYNQAIKKVQITKDELNWENVCAILMRSFYLSEKDKIQLKYKDLENDEITVSCDEDLAEAFNIYFMKNLVKFFVYYSGVFSDQKDGQNTGYSKIPKPKSVDMVPEEIKDKVVEVEFIRKEDPEKNDKETEISNAEKMNEVKPKVANINIDPQELQTIFSEVFSTSEVLKKIQEKLKTYIAKDNKDSNQIVEYSIDTDYQAITNYMMANLNDIINHKIQEKPTQEEESKVQSAPASKNQEKSLLDISLRESFYENSTTQGGFTESMKEKDPKVTSFNSSIECRDLGSQLGVKLVLKYEDGKAKFVAAPAFEYSIIDRNPQNPSIEENKNVIKEEQVDESVENIVLSLKKKASTTEKKGPEFENRMLKKNLHDLDDDLPAPYDKKVIQKFEKGIQDSVYEKID